MTSPRLQNTQAVAAIFAAIAVPLVVALVGWQIQSSISQDSVRKDYVQMALGILSNPDTTKNTSLRQWAVEVLDKNSPVPFSRAVREDFENGFVVIYPKLFEHLQTTSLMTPPQPWIKPPSNYTLEELTENYIDNMSRANDSYLTLQALQKAVRIGAEAEKDFAASSPDQETPEPK